MNLSKLTKTEELCVAYPWEKPYDDIEIQQTYSDNYLDHMSNLQIKSHTSKNTLTNIACSVSPDVTRDLIEKYCERGVSMVVFDINGLSYQESRKMVYEINQGVFNYSLNKNNRIPYSLSLVLDLVGPNIMTGTILKTKSDQSMIKLSTNGFIYVTNDIEYKNKCTEDRIYVSSNKILRLSENDKIFLDYGKIELVVKKIDPEEVYCIIKRGDLLGSQKVVHIPGIPIGMMALTSQDEENIRTGIKLKVDVIMVPGVRDASFFNLVKHFVAQENGQDIELYAKIDNSIGLENIDEIIPVVDGVFLHCPNLSMEVRCDRIFLVQKIILSKCIIVGKPTVTYGRFFESMEFSAVPTKAEVNDVITCVMDGSDCIYLDVTMRSKHKVHCVEYAFSICRQGESVIWEQQFFTELKNKSELVIDPIHAMSIGCVEVSLKCQAAAIIVITTSGLSAKMISRYRPKCPVIAIVVHGKNARKMSVWRNVIAVQYKDPIQTTWSKEVNNRTTFAMEFAKNKGILSHGDLVLLMSTSKENVGFTNNMKLFYVGANDFNEPFH